MMAAELDLLNRDVPLWRLILLLAWPAIVEQLLQTVVAYVDTAMVGSVGVEATAAVGVTTSTVWMLNGFMNAVGVGYSVLTARRLGAGNLEEARNVVRQAVLAVCVLGTILTLLVTLFIAPNLPRWMGAPQEVRPGAAAYLRIVGMSCLFNLSMVVCSNILRCAGDSRTPLKFNTLTNLINVAGNFLLIYPTARFSLFGLEFTLPRAGWGIEGAAAATSLAMTFSGTCMMWVLFFRDSPLRIRPGDDFRPSPRIIRQAAGLAFPVALERISLAVGQLASTAMIAGLGAVSLAAHQLAATGEAICYLPAYGFALAGTALVAQSLGAGERERAFSAGVWCVRLGVLVMLFSAAAMYCFAVPMVRFFTADSGTVALGAKMLRLEVWAEPFLALTIILGGVLRGAGDVRWPVYIATSGMLCLRVPLIWVLIHRFGWDLTAVWGAMIVDWLLRAAISLGRFRGRRWLAAWRESAPADRQTGK